MLLISSYIHVYANLCIQNQHFFGKCQQRFAHCCINGFSFAQFGTHITIILICVDYAVNDSKKVRKFCSRDRFKPEAITRRSRFMFYCLKISEFICAVCPKIKWITHAILTKSASGQLFYFFKNSTLFVSSCNIKCKS